MPINKKKGESKDEFISRCIAIEVGDGKETSQAAAICYAKWDEENMSDITRIRMQKYVKLQSYSDYPKEASENAQAALRWAEKNGWGSCGTPVGKIRANQLAKGEAISRETIARMAGFERHRQNSQKELGDGCGRLMWLAWGGDAGIEWAQRKLQQIDTENFKKWRNSPNSSNVAKIMYNDETRELVLQFNDKSIYTYFDVDFNLFRDIMDGNGICRTEGKNKWGEWYVGKTPSVGAAVYDKLVLSSVRYEKGGSLR